MSNSGLSILTEDAKLVCAHELGTVSIVPSQDLVTINSRKVLVEPDPAGKPITGCPHVGTGIKPCTSTLAVQTGYSDLIRVQNRRVCLDTIEGLTDGTVPGTVKYNVSRSGQNLAEEKQ